MKATQKAAKLIEEMRKIERMERGKICKMKGREHFNHQTWHNGRNQVRYVPREEVAELQAAIDGYARFTELAKRYVDEIIRLSRCERARKHPKNSRRVTQTKSSRRKKRQKTQN